MTTRKYYNALRMSHKRRDLDQTRALLQQKEAVDDPEAVQDFVQYLLGEVETKSIEFNGSDEKLWVEEVLKKHGVSWTYLDRALDWFTGEPMVHYQIFDCLKMHTTAEDWPKFLKYLEHASPLHEDLALYMKSEGEKILLESVHPSPLRSRKLLRL